jgi:hypothetical protein
VTGRFVEKTRQFCPNIAQNGALINKNFARRNYWSKFSNLKTKSSQNVCRACLGEFWAIF